ncbi:MAG: DUF2306 domain-containing protein [Pseudomonadales bacterium]
MRRTIIATTGVLALLGIGLSVEHLIDGDHYNPGFDAYPLTTRSHVVFGGLFLALAMLQFSSRIRAKYSVFHRFSGRVAISMGVISGAAALIIGFVFPFSGTPEVIVTGPFAGLFGLALVRGMWLARHHRFAEHREWMIRSMALATSIATQRLIFVPVLIALGGTLEVAYWLSVTAFAIAFVLHCAVAEWWIRSTRQTNMDTTNASPLPN